MKKIVRPQFFFRAAWCERGRRRCRREVIGARRRGIVDAFRNAFEAPARLRRNCPDRVSVARYPSSSRDWKPVCRSCVRWMSIQRLANACQGMGFRKNPRNLRLSRGSVASSRQHRRVRGHDWFASSRCVHAAMRCVRRGCVGLRVARRQRWFEENFFRRRVVVIPIRLSR